MARKPRSDRGRQHPNLRSGITAAQKQKFLDTLRLGVSVEAAAQAAGAARRTFHTHRQNDTEFAVEWDEAYEAGTDRLEDEVVKLGVKQGNVVALIFMLKGRRPDKFRENNFTLNAQNAQIAFVNAMQRLDSPSAKNFIASELKQDGRRVVSDA